MKRSSSPGSGGRRGGLATKGEPARNIRLAFKLEQAYVSRRRYDRAVRLLDGLLRRSDLGDRMRFEILCRKADCLEHLGRPREAVDLVRSLTRKFRKESLGFSLLGEYLHRIEEDHSGALRALARALKLEPEDPDSLWWRGQVYQVGFAMLGKARSVYRAALAADPEYSPAHESLAVLAETEGKWIEAIDWRKSHYRLTRWPPDLAALAVLYLRLGNCAAARKYARRAVRRAPGDAQAWLVLAEAYAAVSRPGRAAKALRRFAALARRGPGAILSSRDIACLEPALARPEVRKLLKRFPVR